MSHSLSPTNRSSIFGWVKNLKRGSLMSNESVNEISDNDLLTTDSKSPSKSVLSSPNHASHQPIPLPFPSTSSQPPANSASNTSHGFFTLTSPHQEFLRPILNHKSRSANNVNRVRSNSFNQSEKSASIRQHRDSFLQHNPLVDENSKYFGVSLEDAINQACAKISILTNESNDQVLQYGKIPIVVAKCGVYLKNNGLTVEGIFRVGGSSKRLKELQVIFNTPPDFGKKLNWDGYTVHDAASILRRYLNALPEPLIPLELYEEFRDPLRQRPRIINYMKYKAEYPNKSLKPTPAPAPPAPQSPSTPAELMDSDSQPLTEANIGRLNSSNGNTPKPSQAAANRSNSDLVEDTNDDTNELKQAQIDDARLKKAQTKSKNYKKLTRDVHEAINEYKEMVDDLPNLSKQLLFYILDLLAMVQNNSQENLMSSRNLAAIFQPSILSHPNHDMDPVEYALSQSVVEFLIQYAYKLLPDHGASGQAKTNEDKEDPKKVETTTTEKDGESTDEPPAKSGASITPGSSPKSRHPYREQSPSLLNKPPVPSFRRHSKSLSSSSQHDDLIGYNRRNDKNSNLDLDTSDNDYDVTDCDSNKDTSDELDDINFQKSLKLNEDYYSSSDFNFTPPPQIPSTNATDDKPPLLNEPIAAAPAPKPASPPNVSIIVSTPSSKSIPQLDDAKEHNRQ